MSTDLRWRSCWLYSTFFQSYWTFPIQVNSSERRVEYNLSSPATRIWKICITYVIGYFNIILQIFAVIAHISVGDPVKAFLSSIDASFSVFNVLFGYLVLKHGDLGTTSFNFLIILEEHMQSIQSKKKEMLKGPDFIGRVLIFMTVIFGFVPYLVTLTVTIHDIPFLTANEIGILRTVGLVVRKCVFFVTVFEFCRTMCGLLLAMIMSVKIIQKITVDLIKSVQRQYFRFGQYVNVFNGLTIP
jgi:hypothetical protein